MDVTAGQVAEVAGVSKATVARAFSAPQLLRPYTRERVLAVALRLGYRPNRAASSLASGRAGSLGVLVPDLADPFFADVVKALLGRARRHGYLVHVIDSEERARDEHHFAQELADYVDGLILISPRMADEALRTVIGRRPTVLVNRRFDAVPSVVASCRGGIHQAVQHLLAMGHTRCSFVGGEGVTWSGAARRAAFVNACDDLGVDHVELGPFEGGSQFETGMTAADLTVSSSASAFVAFNDIVALGALRRMAGRGVRVPDDVSIVGVDGTVLATSASPSLTCVHVRTAELGERGVDLLLDLLADDVDGRDSVSIDVPAPLIIRDSTGRSPTGTPAPSEPAGLTADS